MADSFRAPTPAGQCLEKLKTDGIGKQNAGGQ